MAVVSLCFKPTATTKPKSSSSEDEQVELKEVCAWLLCYRMQQSCPWPGKGVGRICADPVSGGENTEKTERYVF